MEQRRPSVTISYAQTLDGRLATRSGSSQWIGGPASLHFAHALRASHQAILVGVGTVLADDPRLTVRLVAGNNPLRVIVDGLLRTPLGAAVLRDGAARGTLLACRAEADAGRRAAIMALGAEVVTLPAGARGGIDLAALLALLAARGVASVMVEGGARLITSLLRERLAERLAVCMAPKILGEGISAIGDLGIDRLDAAYSLQNATLTPYGQDWIIDGRLSYPD